MVERLNDYLAKFEQEKIEIEQENYEETIARLVSEYETKVRAEYETTRQENLEAKSIEISTIKKLIELEKTREEAEKFQNTDETSETVDGTLEGVSIDNL